MNLFFILGAPDPEMQAIERLLTDAGVSYGYATSGGRRVHTGTAYAADGCTLAVPEDASVCVVECEVQDLTAATCVDHHRPGDPGYGCEPERFFLASSLGQTVVHLAKARLLPPAQHSAGIRVDRSGDAELVRCAAGGHYLMVHGAPKGVDHSAWGESADGMRMAGASHMTWGKHDPRWFEKTDHTVEVRDEWLLTAAADHCLAAAYRGECPGVAPEALMRWRAESRAAFQKRTVEDVLADVERARAVLRSAPQIWLGESATCDWHDHTQRKSSDEDCYNSAGSDWSYDPCVDAFAVRVEGCVPELPEASARDGVCFVAEGLPGPDGRIKVVCQSGAPEQIRAFMRSYAPRHGLIDVYGDPARGFAGGYLE